MNLKKTLPTLALVLALVATMGIAVAENGHGLGEDSVEAAQETTTRYLIKSNNSVLKMMYGVNHNFDRGFTTDLTHGQLKVLEKFGIEVAEVELYHISARPTCNYNGTCEPELGENPSCADCKTGGEEPPIEERVCEPSAQIPWGITKVNGGSGGEGINVAVLDTGVYKEHLDLNIKMCVDATKRKIKDGCADTVGHGTHVTGTIAANGGSDGLGVFGVAPKANLFAIKVCRVSGCWADDVAAGIRYAADNDANIISMSLGGSSESSLIKDAIDDAIGKGVLVIASAGNSGSEEDTIGYPAANINVVAVAAFDSSDAIASWSSRGVNDNDWIIEEREIEFAAPGVLIESTWKDGCYNTISGTSMAAPHITGIAARDWQGSASATRGYLQDLAEIYTNNTLDYGQAGDDIEAGFGLPMVP